MASTIMVPMVASRSSENTLDTSSPHGMLTAGSPASLRRVCEGSLRRLKVERIDLYQFHRPDPNVSFAESVGFARRTITIV